MRAGLGIELTDVPTGGPGDPSREGKAESRAVAVRSTSARREERIQIVGAGSWPVVLDVQVNDVVVYRRRHNNPGPSMSHRVLQQGCEGTRSEVRRHRQHQGIGNWGQVDPYRSRRPGVHERAQRRCEVGVSDATAGAGEVHQRGDRNGHGIARLGDPSQRGTNLFRDFVP